MPPSEDDTSSLERARERLYKTDIEPLESRTPLSIPDEHALPHAWGEDPLVPTSRQKRRHIRVAGAFFAVALAFFVISLGVAWYFLYFEGNTVSTNNITLNLEGPTSIAGGDTVPLELTITNKNPVAIENATLEVNFPEGTRDANNVLQPYPRYNEKIGTLESGATITRSLKAAIFGGAGQTLAVQSVLSYDMVGSNSVYVKKSSFPLTISSTPLDISVDTLSETVSGKPLTFNITVRSNAKVTISSVVLTSIFPFGFVVSSSSVPLNNSSFLLGTLAPGATKTITLTGTLAGQDSEERVFHFSIGTANTANDQALAVTYMTKDVPVTVTAPFINTTIALNGDTGANVTVPAGSRQSVTVSYTNTLATNVANVVVAVAISGSGVDYGSIETTRGFYRSLDHTVLFGPDTDPALANLAPGASGIGTFTFSTLAPGALASSPSITFTTSVSGSRVGQTNVPEEVNASATKTAKVVTAISLTAHALHSSGPIANSGPVPPISNQATTYSVVWNVKNQGSAVADGTVSATLPSYVSYTGKTAGSGSFSYDAASRTVSWNTGNLAQGANTGGTFQVSLTPSTSQMGSAPALTSSVSFSGYDRFAGVQVRATAGAATTETTGDSGYSSSNANVQ